MVFVPFNTGINKMPMLLKVIRPVLMLGVALSCSNGLAGEGPCREVEGASRSGKKAPAHWIALLKDKEVGNRREAARALRRLKPQSHKAIASLLTALNDQDDDVLGLAAQALGAIGVKAFPGLIEAFKTRSFRVRAYILVPLVTIASSSSKGLEESVPKLCKALKSNDEAYRSVAILLLGSMGSKAKKAAPNLLKLLKDPDATTRLSALNSLRKIGTQSEAVLKALEPVLKDKDERVAKAAKETIDVLKKTSKKS